MLITFVKHFVIAVCAFYFFGKILRFSNEKNMYSTFLIYGLFGSFSGLVAIIYLPLVFILEPIFLIVIYHKEVKDKNIDYVLAAINACGFSNLIFLLSIVSSSVFFITYIMENDRTIIMDNISFLIMLFFQFVFSYICSNGKQFKNGLKFMGQHSNVLVFLNILILFMLALFAWSDMLLLYEFICACILVSLSFLILYWWKRHALDVYQKRLLEREIERKEIYTLSIEKEKDIAKEEIKRLSALIHRDNKLLPAMSLAVLEAIKDHESQEKRDLLNMLSMMEKERSVILKTIKDLSPVNTGDTGLDAMLIYMREKAVKNQVDFSIEIREKAKDTVNVQDLGIIICDLVDNGIKATQKSESKKMIVEFSKVKGDFYISVLDNGVNICPCVYKSFGIGRMTTYRNKGGSGIGLMTLWEILKKYNASICFYEFETGEYTKKIVVIFDNKGKITIHTHRQKELRRIINRKDMDIIYY